MLGTMIARHWQHALPGLLVALGVCALVLHWTDLAEPRVAFGLTLLAYLAHQIEEHLWPGGFRTFANTVMFRTGEDEFPVSRGGVAFVNITFVWLPLGLATLYPATLFALGMAFVGLTFINALTHIGATARVRRYNPGLVTSLVLFLPLTSLIFAAGLGAGTLSSGTLALSLVAGVLLHVPVMALFVVPFLRRRATS